MLNGNVLKVSDQEKDLGVLTLGTLLWTDQISSSIKANMLISWIARSIIKARGGVNVIFSVFTYVTELLKTNK